MSCYTYKLANVYNLTNRYGEEPENCPLQRLPSWQGKHYCKTKTPLQIDACAYMTQKSLEAHLAEVTGASGSQVIETVIELLRRSLDQIEEVASIQYCLAAGADIKKKDVQG